MTSEGGWRLLAVLAASSLAIAGCTGGGGTASPSGAAGGATTIDVTLQEWAVVTASGSAPAGDITFDVTNDGPDDIHEFVVMKTDLEAADLPTDSDGVVDEEGDGIEVIDEIEDLPVGESRSITVALDAGSYVLICNIWDEEEGEAHYAMGMRTPFTVGE